MTTTSLLREDGGRLCDLAAERLDAGQAAEARELLLRARAIAPTNPRVHYLLAVYYSDTRQVAAALDAVDESLRLDGTNAKAHNNRGSALLQLGRATEAEGAFRRAMEINTRLEPPYINLGHILETRGAIAEACDVYSMAIAQGLDREMFEQYRAAAAGRDTAACPESWVRSTFDNFAPTFDEHLRTLGYDVPDELAKRLRRRIDGTVDILDLGCGTGKCGAVLASVKRSLHGVDLSSKMVAAARRLSIYDELHVAEVQAFLASCPAQSCDVIVAADVFIYIGDLARIFREASRVLRPGGWFAFSTEEATDRDYALLRTGRYAQAEAYIRRLAKEQFSIECAEGAVIRTESGHPLHGRLYLLQRRLDAPERVRGV